ncbi:AMP-binding protein [Ralstonia solanacearum]|uniref:AMP-binding protein n=1 Tax=Ralstonia solanacearum TaxID=305 RepID=UPI0007C8D7A1|nr:AMP-binding protein [Ralstonia solanacearum]MDB0529585.1 AMP-binding protein [Ralstonia solanacearum]OAI74588.1 long-chain fatty acid--CoA ligase [Ralstonia solanacearum]
MPAHLIFEDHGTDADTLLARGAAMAGGLRRMGVHEGYVIGVLLRNAPAYIDVMHACRIAGCHFCPINWHFTPAEVEFLVRDSGAKVLIGHRDLVDAVEPLLPPHVQLLRVDAEGTDRADGYANWLALQTPYDGPVVSPRGHMAYTSGTTGRPKGVVRQAVTLDQLDAHLQKARAVVAATFGIAPGCRALLPAPLYHSAPSVFAQQAAQIADVLVLNERFDALRVLEQIERYRIDTVYLVPIMYVRLLKLTEEERNLYDLSSLRFVASTGAPCAPEIKRRMIDWLGHVIYETYASSETGMITVMDPRDVAARPGSAGLPVCGAQVRILCEDGTPCTTGEVGLIYCRQPAFPDFTYRGNDDARGKIECDGLVTLGDMGYLDTDGYLYVCDRASDMVISGGVNIYPAEIEHALLRHPDVVDCAVFGVPDDEYGERLIAMVQTGSVSLRAEPLIDWLRGQIAGYKIPRQIEFTATLPRDDNGKIAKRRLRDAWWGDRQRRV